MLYDIQPICPASMLAPLASRVRTNKEKHLCSGANCSNTHNIISSMAPHEFNVILRTTTDEFNVLPRTNMCQFTPYKCFHQSFSIFVRQDLVGADRKLWWRGSNRPIKRIVQSLQPQWNRKQGKLISIYPPQLLYTEWYRNVGLLRYVCTDHVLSCMPVWMQFALPPLRFGAPEPVVYISNAYFVSFVKMLKLIMIKVTLYVTVTCQVTILDLISDLSYVSGSSADKSMMFCLFLT